MHADTQWRTTFIGFPLRNFDLRIISDIAIPSHRFMRILFLSVLDFQASLTQHLFQTQLKRLVESFFDFFRHQPRASERVIDKGDKSPYTHLPK